MSLINTEQIQVDGHLTKYEYYDNHTVKVYHYCGCPSSPWKFIKDSTWIEIDNKKVVQ